MAEAEGDGVMVACTEALADVEADRVQLPVPVEMTEGEAVAVAATDALTEYVGLIEAVLLLLPLNERLTLGETGERDGDALTLTVPATEREVESEPTRLADKLPVTAIVTVADILLEREGGVAEGVLDEFDVG